ncbi:cyclin-T1-3 [Cocos nucifera]|uniref:Cyclin-T1-3 n=1 Tax=Cocos nucifera TaxID=13894 RepID=A0A8K0ID24_COCNU|nr:cyclin-T1-3 [Cocos nucifera]
MMESSPYRRLEEVHRTGSTWYFSRKEIEENSPSKRDGIDLKKETYLRKSYCTFLQDLGMRLKVPQVTIATAIVFCHRFFLRQSHAKNDRRTIATMCMFLAGKVEETPRPLKDVILVSYEIIHKKDPAAVQRIKQREVYEQQKELILIGERLVLATLGFDLNVHHPYKPLVEAIKKFKVAQNALAQVAWNFVNDGLRTSLCLQFKPHHIAAGAIFLAAKFLKVKLPSDGEKVWWQEFDVTPRQLEGGMGRLELNSHYDISMDTTYHLIAGLGYPEVSNQMLELYEQNRVTQPPSHGNEAEGSFVTGTNPETPVKAPAAIEESSQNGYSQATKTAGMHSAALTGSLARPVPDQLHPDRQNGAQRVPQNESKGHGSNEQRSGFYDNKAEPRLKDHWHPESGIVTEAINSRSNYGSECPVEESSMPVTGGSTETKDRNIGGNEGPKVYSPLDAIKKIDKDKVKAALEKRRKSRGDVARKVDLMDEDDLIERELEHGVELAVEDERIKQERRHGWSKPLYRQEPQNLDRITENGYLGADKAMENVEEGELSLDSQEFHSPEPGSQKRKAVSPGKQFVGKDGFELPHHHASSSKHHHDTIDDSRVMGRFERAEREHKRPRQENQV